MKILAFAGLALVAGAALAQAGGMKAGLWEVKPVSQIVDGQDMSQRMAAAQAQMQKALENMTPEQRKQMASMMGRGGMPGAGGGMRICISPAMAARKEAVTDPQGHCPPAKVSQSGNKTSFDINCTHNGQTTVGSGESVVNGDSVNIKMDATTTDARGKHVMHMETQMSYLGADCQGVTPADQMAKGMAGAPKP